MIPLALVQMENYPGFLCSYDNVNWWKTEALPNTIDKIIGTEWIYGEHHIFACSNKDGTYSIYQSYHAINDNVADLHWRETLNTVERIRCLIRPDYGRALIGTSTGWWRSENAGKDFTKVSVQAPNCFCVKELTNDILVAISKNDIWRSADCGTSWTSKKHTSTNIDYPAIDGTYYDVLVGIGNALWYSGDGALTFEYLAPNVAHGIKDFPSNYPITDIELSNTGLTTVDNVPTFVIQCLLPSGHLRHYYILRHITVYENEYAFFTTAKFDGFSSLSNSLTSEEIQETGSSSISSVIMFSGSDENGPILKESDDGGVNWDTINVQDAPIYDSSALDHVIAIGGPFSDGTYFKASWSHANVCHNYWHIYDTHLKKGQSYDIGATILNYHYDDITYNIGAYSNKKIIVSHNVAGRLLGIPIKTYSIDVHIGEDTLKTYDMDMFSEGPGYAIYYCNSAVQDSGLQTYEMNGRIIIDEFPRLVGPQALDWRFAAFSENGWPYDSRNEV